MKLTCPFHTPHSAQYFKYTPYLDVMLQASRFSTIVKRIQATECGIPTRTRFGGLASETNIFDMFLERRRSRNFIHDPITEPDLELTEPKLKKRRDNEGYDPSNARHSNWYKCYVGEKHVLCLNPSKKRGRKFRRRFRMTMTSFLGFIKIIREENWFPECEKRNALGQIGIPLELLVLGSLRYLGRGWTFDDLEEATGISEESHRKFFHKFIRACRIHFYPKYVIEPSSKEEIEDAMAEFSEAGFNGCIGSADATHIIMEKCSARLKNQHTGGKLSQSARAFQITVNHRRRILSSTVGFPGRWNDKTIVRFDSFINRIHRGLLYEDVKYDLYKSNGKTTSMQGAWILVGHLCCNIKNFFFPVQF